MRRPSLFKTQGLVVSGCARCLAISSLVVMIWHLSLGALIDCTWKFEPNWKWPDPGSGGFWGLVISLDRVPSGGHSLWSGPRPLDPLRTDKEGLDL